MAVVNNDLLQCASDTKLCLPHGEIFGQVVYHQQRDLGISMGRKPVALYGNYIQLIRSLYGNYIQLIRSLYGNYIQLIR